MRKKKTKDVIAAPVPVPVPPGVSCDERVCKLPVDEYHGIGGSYVIDPSTGKRTPVGADSIRPKPETGTATETTEKEKADEIE